MFNPWSWSWLNFMPHGVDIVKNLNLVRNLKLQKNKVTTYIPARRYVQLCKPHYGNQEFFPLVNGVYFSVIIKKTALSNGNSPITDPFTEMGVLHSIYLRVRGFMYYFKLKLNFIPTNFQPSLVG